MFVDPVDTIAPFPGTRAGPSAYVTVPKMRTCSLGLLLIACAALLLGCSSSEDTLYGRLGKEPGIQSIVEKLVSELQADPKINGYFLNSSTDLTRFKSCLVKQIAHSAGGPQAYDCAPLKAAHAGRGVSGRDFDDWMGHLRSALSSSSVAQKDIDALVVALAPAKAEVVEDPDGGKTAYQRLGRKPAIQALVADFHRRVLADPLISGFFTGVNTDRIAVCSVRQICQATSGPCRYGEEIANAEPPVVTACRTMKESHAGLGITVPQFNALLADMTAALDASTVPSGDRLTILQTLRGFCPDIVEVGICP